ncbi:putative MFS alpha-glucoside transporter [Exidia glandulosa HHB12029]|uniref:Putative MFS alpha-glucoside transporter n=1 Tax=Exidia glandulosa HHB12029 TaxID=1314781 RepID=A0A165IQX7_EXIGL|nr:putative MFS alpha-glucoside transporter [Exidia glandulosa HHB12029]
MTSKNSDVVIAHNEEFKHSLGANVVNDAQKADAAEHTMTLREAFKTHKRAIFWSMALSSALIMEGYDVVVIASFYGHPAFTKRFGVLAPGSTTEYIIPADWQSGLGNGSSAGAIIGLLVNGWAADRYGPKVVMISALVALTGFIFIPVFAESLSTLVVGEVLCGISWGVYQTLTTAYASEVCPIQLRGYLTAYVNLCWGVGILISSGVVKATLNIESDWSWRLPFVVQWVWVVPLFLIFFFAPPSPWWLVRKGRLEEAEQAVKRLTNPERVSEEEIRNTVSMMVHTNELEKAESSGTSYIDCFRRTDLRRTEIVIMVFAMQLLSGQNLIGQGVQFFVTAGMDTANVFSLNMVLNAMFIIGTLVSWCLMPFFGRRTVYTAGMFCMCVVLYTIGGLAYNPSNGSMWASGSLLVVLNLVYNSTLGPICYTLIAELPSTRLRAKSIALSRCAYQVMNIICGIIVPRMLSPASWNWGPKSGLFWGTSAFLCTCYCLLRLPESKGRAYGELDILFENKVPAWRFKSTKVDQFAGHTVDSKKDIEDGKEGSDIKEDIEHIH